MRIFFTGGSGKAGAHVVRHLHGAGHHVTNADLVPLGAEGIDDLTVDVTDRGQLASALGTWSNLESFAPGGPPPYDALVHFAAIPRIGIVPDAECYRINTVSTWNALETARAAGISRIVIASSETTYGVCFSARERTPLWLPVDETHPTEPEDAYALSKVANEVAARGVAMRGGASITALRIGNVVEPHEYPMFRDFLADPALRRRNIFNWVDVRDLARMVELSLGVEAPGYRVYNAASGNSVDLPAPEIARRFFPEAEIRGELADETPIYSIARAEAELGYSPAHDWRDELARAEAAAG